MSRLPAFFISHGAPNLLLQKKDPTYAFLQNLGREIKKLSPKAILSISAHWEEPQFSITSNEQPETIYDFGGFEDEMYQMRYPAKTSPELIDHLSDLLSKSHIPFKLHNNRGFDHGTWSPLKIMLPEADIPVVQISLLRSLDPSKHYDLGKALAPLRDEGFLVFGSGGVTHNLGSSRSMNNVNGYKQFEQFVTESITQRTESERETLLKDFPSHPQARLSHPRTEHFLPLLVVAGTGGPGTRIHDEWQASFSLAAYKFDLIVCV